MTDLPAFIASLSPSEVQARRWSAGQRVVWPNGVEGAVCGVDFSDGTLLDECGGWHDMADVDVLA